VYLDLWDIPGDIQVSVPPRPGWQFVYGTFTPWGSAVGIRAVIDGNVQPSDELQVDELAITPLARFLPPENHVALFNVRFGASGAAPIEGPAAYGEASNDFWNSYSRDDGNGGYKSMGSVVPLLDSRGVPSTAGLVVQNAPGAWNSGASHPLMSLYLYPLGGSPRITLTATNLPTGFYDAYLYGHGGPGDTYNTAFTLSSGAIVHGTRKTTTNEGWQAPPWVEGRQFVLFKNVFVTRGEPLVILADRDAQYIPSLNGIQLVQRTTDPDEISSDWRLKYFGEQAELDPRAASASDPDNDGSDNLTEYRAGTSPVDPLDGFASGIRQIPSIRWTSVVGATYRILRKERLPDSPWIEIKRVQAAAATTEYIDPGVEGQPRFYRVEAVR